MEQYIEQAQILVTKFGLKILAALAVFIIGMWVAKILRKSLSKLMDKWKWDKTLITFLTNLTYFGLIGLVVLAALSQLGVETTSFVAVLGAAGLAVGLALQGSLANFASGVLIIIFRPFKVDDFVELSGEQGFVEDIHIFTTQIRTFDNRTIIMPNSMITGDKIENFSAKKIRRVDISVGISYSNKVRDAREVILNFLKEDERVLKNPPPAVFLTGFGDSSLDLTVRPWCKTEDYWEVNFATLEKIKDVFDENNVSIPFPQRDVHLFEHKDK